jgi:hypothetical protein
MSKKWVMATAAAMAALRATALGIVVAAAVLKTAAATVEVRTMAMAAKCWWQSIVVLVYCHVVVLLFWCIVVLVYCYVGVLLDVHTWST